MGGDEAVSVSVWVAGKNQYNANRSNLGPEEPGLSSWVINYSIVYPPPPPPVDSVLGLIAVSPVLPNCHQPKTPQSINVPFGSKKTSDPKIMSTGGRESSWGDTRPQVSPMTGTWGRRFSRQLLRQLCRHCGSSSLSDSTTAAPHRAASTPGRLTPAPTWNTERGGGLPPLPPKAPGGQRGCAATAPPAPACRAGSAGAPRGTGPGPRRRATRTCRTASPAPETHRARRWDGAPAPRRSRFPRRPPSPCPAGAVPRGRAAPAPPAPPRSGTAARRRAAAAPPWPRPAAAQSRAATPGRADQSAPSPRSASRGAPRRAPVAAAPRSARPVPRVAAKRSRAATPAGPGALPPPAGRCR